MPEPVSYASRTGATRATGRTSRAGALPADARARAADARAAADPRCRRGRRRRPRRRAGRAHVRPLLTTGSRRAASRSAPARGGARRRRRLVGERRRDGGAAASAATLSRARRPLGAATTPPTRAPPGRRSSSRGRCSAHRAVAPSPTCSASDGDEPEFVVEVEHDGTATLRFGDGDHGRRPDEGTAFTATTASATAAPATSAPARSRTSRRCSADVVGVANPLPAAGGTEPEPADAVRRDAPEAFLVQQRAVTADDYARGDRARPRRCSAPPPRSAGPGSWHTVFVTADRAGGRAVDAGFETELRRYLEPFRMAGYDLEVDAPRFVPLEVGLHVCVAPDHFRVARARPPCSTCSRAGVRADGTLGFFHPDRFTFGQPVYLSRDRRGGAGGRRRRVGDARRRSSASATTPRAALDTGVLPMGRLEIARLDNDPSFPERGVLTLTTGGGK